jgi:hypothetical protein
MPLVSCLYSCYFCGKRPRGLVAGLPIKKTVAALLAAIVMVADTIFLRLLFTPCWQHDSDVCNYNAGSALIFYYPMLSKESPEQSAD